MAQEINISEGEAIRLLNKYEFSAKGQYYTVNRFIVEVKKIWGIPDWAKCFEKLDFASYIPRFKNTQPTENGLVRFSDSNGYFYRVDKKPPEKVFISGFDASNDYTAIDKMIPSNEPGLIVAGNLQGALRYNTLVKSDYIYKIKGYNIRGVSLKENLMTNQEGLKSFLNLPLEKRYHTLDSLATECNGAIYLDEIHLYQQDINVGDITLLSDDEMKIVLADGPWKNYF